MGRPAHRANRQRSASATIGAPIAAETTAVSSSATGVEAARAGLARWLKENRPATPLTSTDIDRCPAIELTTLTKALITVGLTDELQDWGTEIEWNEYEALSPDLMGIVCGGDSDGEAHRSEIGTAAGVIAVALTTFDKLVKDFEIELGQDGVTAAQCFEDSGATTCVEVRDPRRTRHRRDARQLDIEGHRRRREHCSTPPSPVFWRMLAAN